MAARARRRWFLREWRLYRGWSQDELAAASGVPRSRISELETGSERYNQDVLEALAAALTRPGSPVEPGDLIGRDPNGPRPLDEIWDRIPESQRGQARRVMESFAADFEADAPPKKAAPRTRGGKGKKHK